MPEVNELNKNAMGGTELMGLALEKHVDKDLLSNFQIIQSRVREIDNTKIPILWLHDLPGDPESEHLRAGGWNKFEKIVFVSHWQQQAYNAAYGVPFNKSIVLQNAIEPINPIVKSKDKIKIIYHTTPHRGLQILVPVFIHLANKYPEIELDVYSSFKLYGWEDRDKPFEELFQMCRDHPQINYHGAVSNEEVRKALSEAHIFAYPSIWKETSCISLIEAMSAECVCVHPTLAALPETASNFTCMYPWTEDNRDHAQGFYNVMSALLNQMISKVKSGEEYNFHQKSAKWYVDSTYNWSLRGAQWTSFLSMLLNSKKRNNG